MSMKKDQEMLDRVVNLLKEHSIVKEIFDKFNANIDAINEIPITFDKIDSSAKARNGEIILNENLKEGDFTEDLHYIVHELTHVLQQRNGLTKNTNLKFIKHYLDNPLEVEAFKYQIKFIEDYKGKEEADKYLENLLDYHEYSGKDREDKEKELLGNKCD